MNEQIMTAVLNNIIHFISNCEKLIVFDNLHVYERKEKKITFFPISHSLCYCSVLLFYILFRKKMYALLKIDFDKIYHC